MKFHGHVAPEPLRNGLDPEEEIRKAREKLNDEMAEKEAKLEEEQKLLEEKMQQERPRERAFRGVFGGVSGFGGGVHGASMLGSCCREEFEKQIEALKKSGQRSTVKVKEEDSTLGGRQLRSPLEILTHRW